MTGWKVIITNVNYEVRCLNNKLVEYIIHTDGTVSVTNAVQTLKGWIPSGYIPPYNVTTIVPHGWPVITCRTDGAVGYHSISGTGSSKLNGTLYWRKS